MANIYRYIIYIYIFKALKPGRGKTCYSSLNITINIQYSNMNAVNRRR